LSAADRATPWLRCGWKLKDGCPAADRHGVTDHDTAELSRFFLELHHGPGFDDHGSRVATLSVATGRALGLDDGEVARLRLAALLHDLGKAEIDHALLGKAGPLTDAELIEIRRHPEIGYHRLGEVVHESVREAVLCHHEWFNGEGYPTRLRGRAIPLFSRIIFVADAYEVMTTGGAYKPRLDIPAAAEELRRGVGIQFDPEIVDAFASLDRSLLAFLD
jgi:HD-GYP domain-containing protein (c-di-GMP phosphodiesterase class II)